MHVACTTDSRVAGVRRAWHAARTGCNAFDQHVHTTDSSFNMQNHVAHDTHWTPILFTLDQVELNQSNFQSAPCGAEVDRGKEHCRAEDGCQQVAASLKHVRGICDSQAKTCTPDLKAKTDSCMITVAGLMNSFLACLLAILLVGVLAYLHAWRLA